MQHLICEYMDLIILSNFPVTPHFTRRNPNFLCETLSKAFLQSIKQQYNLLTFRKDLVIKKWRAKMASVVPKPGRKSNCASVITECLSLHLVSLELINTVCQYVKLEICQGHSPDHLVALSYILEPRYVLSTAREITRIKHTIISIQICQWKFLHL